MKYTVDEVMKYIEEEDAKFIRLVFRDAFGVQKNIAVMPGEIEKAFEEGIPINARQIAGFEDSPCASLYLRPDSSTLAVLPWRPESGRVLRMLCDVCTPDGEVYPSDTRAVLKEAVRKAKAQSDYCIVVMHWGSEGKSTPNEKQHLLSEGAAEAGADLVIGGHPHVLQSIGRVGSVPVVYSLGNYLFHSGTYDTGVVQAVFRPAEHRLESLRFVPMQCRNMKVFTLSGSEKERLLSYMRSLSPDVHIDGDGVVTLP